MNEELIKKRRSFESWKKLLDKLNKGMTKAEILKLIHHEIDYRNGFGSQTNSDKSLESLQYVLRCSPPFVEHEIIGKKENE